MYGPGQQRRRILVVDDDPVIRHFFRATLKGDYEVEEAASGEEALLLAADGSFDVLLLDINMPGIGGYKTCRRLKSAPERAPQIVMISARSSSKEQIESFWEPGTAKSEIEAGSGSQFDPAVVEAFRRRFDDFLAVQRQHSDRASIVTGAMAFAEFEPVLTR